MTATTTKSSWVPMVYEENKVKVLEHLREGDVEYMDLSNWSYQDRFFAFLLGIRFFELCAASYPSPRKKEEVPLWFLLCCAVQMRMNTTSAYSKLPGLLKNGPVLSRVKFNVGGMEGGFNNKNRYDRTCPVDFDCVRKFYKDTPRSELRKWYNQDVTRFYRHNRAFDKHGIFVLDQTHVVVPRNKHYADAALMRVDEYGHRYDTEGMSEEQKRALPLHPCYALSELLHVGKDDKCFMVAGYQWGPGNTDDVAQGKVLVQDFVDAVGKDVMKLLIVDRGFVDGVFIDLVCQTLKSQVLLPLKKNMDIYLAAQRRVESADWNGKWTPYRTYVKNGVTYQEEVCVVDDHNGIWENCSTKLYVAMMRTKSSGCADYTYWALATSFRPKKPKEAFETYALRTEIEERHKQLKLSWHIDKFSSPHESLVEAHVLFTLLTYTLVQLHLVKKHLVDLTSKTIESLKAEESVGTNSVIVYHGGYFAVFNLDDYTLIVADLEPHARDRLKTWIERQKKMFQPSG
jgi:hypothetical protein